MTHKTRVAVLVSGFGSNLQTFIDGAQNGTLPIEIVGVISNKEGVFGLERARNAGIANQCMPHGQYADRETFDQALLAQLEDWQTELVVLAGFMRILTSRFVEHFKNRLINIHPSLLPSYTGLNTHQRVIDAAEQWHGASVHFVTPELDAGPVIVQGKLQVHKYDTAESLEHRIHTIEHQIYPVAVQWIAEGKLCITNEGTVLLNQSESTEQVITFNV
jgi:phosphoribosylglycinamide formyltransferase 1